MEPESSLPYSQAPATCPYPEHYYYYYYYYYYHHHHRYYSQFILYLLTKNLPSRCLNKASFCAIQDPVSTILETRGMEPPLTQTIKTRPLGCCKKAITVSFLWSENFH